METAAQSRRQHRVVLSSYLSSQEKTIQSESTVIALAVDEEEEEGPPVKFDLRISRDMREERIMCSVRERDFHLAVGIYGISSGRKR